MKSLANSEKCGLAGYVVHPAYYALIGRDYEWELVSLALDRGLDLIIWSPLGWGRLTGGRGQAGEGRIASSGTIGEWQEEDDYLYEVVDALDVVAEETGKTAPQVTSVIPMRPSGPSAEALWVDGLASWTCRFSNGGWHEGTARCH